MRRVGSGMIFRGVGFCESSNLEFMMYGASGARGGLPRLGSSDARNGLGDVYWFARLCLRERGFE